MNLDHVLKRYRVNNEQLSNSIKRNLIVGFLAQAIDLVFVSSKNTSRIFPSMKAGNQYGMFP